MAQKAGEMLPKIVKSATFSKSLDPRKIEKSVSDIRFPFESSFWISVSGCKLIILPGIHPANRIMIISGTHQAYKSNKCWENVFLLSRLDTC